MRTGNAFTAVLLALVNALGMWTVPTMLYASAMVYRMAALERVPGLDGARPDRAWS